MERSIVHLGIPDFCASMEELRRPELKRRPVVLAGPSARTVVQGVNGIARKEGIREGMPLSRAERLCRRLLVVPPDVRFYREEHRLIVEELGRFSPLVEGTQPGRYFVDLTGSGRLLGPGPDTACRMERRLAESKGLRARVGLATNKLVSRVAADCIAPGDMSCVFSGAETSFLSHLPVTRLPGVGPATASRLADFNILQIGKLAAIPAESLFLVFGKMSFRLLNLAGGIDPTPVLPARRESRLCVVRNLDGDEIDRDGLEAALFLLVEDAGWNLRNSNRHPRRFALEIRHADGVAARSENTLPDAAASSDRRLFRFALPAFRRLAERRVAIRRMALEFSDFSMPFRQLPLFPWEDEPPHENRNLQEALDAVRRRFGPRAVAWGKISAMNAVSVHP